MNTGLDLAISAIIGGILLMLLLDMKGNLNKETEASFISSQPQMLANSLKDILDYDIPKIGYGLVRPKQSILAADSSVLRFALDTSRAGTYDSVSIEYQLKPGSGGDSTVNTNPKQIQLNRTVKKGGSVSTRLISQGLISFAFRYYDAEGNQLAVPVAAGNLPMIKMVRVLYRVESLWQVHGAGDNTFYPGLDVNKLYRPRNLL